MNFPYKDYFHEALLLEALKPFVEDIRSGNAQRTKDESLTEAIARVEREKQSEPS